MSRHADVLIVGGGVIGLTTAYLLARAKFRVVVVDRADLGREASWGGAGIIPPGGSEQAGNPFDCLRALSVEQWPSFSEELRDLTGIDNGYRRCGGIELPEDATTCPDEEWCAPGTRCETLHGEDLHQLEPALGPTWQQGHHLPDLAQLRNPWHLRALEAACARSGVTLHPGCPVFTLDREGNRVVAVTTGHGRFTAERFVLAAGAWSDSLLAQVGWQPGVRPVRGQIALLRMGSPLFRRVIMQGKRYLVPRPEGRVLIGSTEENVGFVKETTAEGIHALLGFAMTLVPGLSRAVLERSWAGLRPGSPDGLPFMGAVPGLDNLVVNTGHFRSGIQLSLGSGLVITRLLRGERVASFVEAFRLDRGPFRS